MRIVKKCVPLGCEFILYPKPEAALRVVFCRIFLGGGVVSLVVIPSAPAPIRIFDLERHKECVILHPIGLAAKESTVSRIGHEAGMSKSEQLVSRREEPSVVYALVFGFCRLKLRFRE